MTTRSGLKPTEPEKGEGATEELKGFGWVEEKLKGTGWAEEDEEKPKGFD